jgi:hypothetical protein
VSYGCTSALFLLVASLSTPLAGRLQGRKERKKKALLYFLLLGLPPMHSESKRGESLYSKTNLIRNVITQIVKSRISIYAKFDDAKE